MLFASFCAHKSKLFLTQKSCSLPHSLPSSAAAAAAAEKAEEKEVLFLFMISHFSFEKEVDIIFSKRYTLCYVFFIFVYSEH